MVGGAISLLNYDNNLDYPLTITLSFCYNKYTTIIIFPLSRRKVRLSFYFFIFAERLVKIRDPPYNK